MHWRRGLYIDMKMDAFKIIFYFSLQLCHFMLASFRPSSPGPYYKAPIIMREEFYVKYF